MRQMRTRIGNVTLQAPDFSLALVPGLVVDLDKRLPAGGTVADLVRLDWFEPLEPEPEPVTRRARRQPTPTDDPITPVSPAASEE